MNYVILRKFIDRRTINELLSFSNPELSQPEDIGLADGELANIWHESQRNKGMSYLYSTDEAVQSLSKGIKVLLNDATGIEFVDDLSSKATVFCRYEGGGCSNAHRDRNKITGTGFQKYTAIVLLSSGKTSIRPGTATYLFGKDEFFINFNSDSYQCEEGRKVYAELEEYRFYPNLQEGDIIVFRNDISIHGVEPVVAVDGEYRITCAWRSK